MGASSIIFNSLGVGPVVTFFDKISNRESGQDDEFPPNTIGMSDLLASTSAVDDLLRRKAKTRPAPLPNSAINYTTFPSSSLTRTL